MDDDSNSNPALKFKYHGFVHGEFATSRPEEPLLRNLIGADERVYLDGPRRCGKTSIALTCAQAIGRNTIHLDLLGVENRVTLFERIDCELRAFVRNHPEVKNRIRNQGNDSMKATISAGLPGVLSVSLVGDKTAKVERDPVTLDDLLRAAVVLARQAEAVIFVDEFQTVQGKTMERPSEVVGTFAAACKPSLTEQTGPCWLFAGSNRHAMHQIFGGIAAAFFTNITRLPIGPIPMEIMMPFLCRRLGVRMPAEVQRSAYLLTEGVPGDLQRLFHALSMIVHDGKLTEVGPEHLEKAKTNTLREIGPSYALTLRSLYGKSEQAVRMLDVIVAQNVRTLAMLRSAWSLIGGTDKGGDEGLLVLLEEGLLHLDDSGELQRPEPLMFQYLQRKPARDHVSYQKAFSHKQLDMPALPVKPARTDRGRRKK
jgi:hypothetical protein